MKLTHNFRIFFRKIFSELGTITRAILIFSVLAIFLASLFYESSDLFFAQNIHVAGVKSTKAEEVDINKNLEQAAENIALGQISQAVQKLKFVLEFEPNNVYANEMNGNLVRELDNVEREITRTLEIIHLQPNWKEAWVKLADLYEKTGNFKLEAEAREKARSLRTS